MNFPIATDPVVPTHHAVLSSFMRETGSPTQPLSQKLTKTWKQLGDRFGSRSEYWSNNALVNTPFNKTTFGLLSSRTAELCESFKYFLKNRYCASQITCQPVYICLKADTPMVMNCSYSAIERLEWKRSTRSTRSWRVSLQWYTLPNVFQQRGNSLETAFCDPALRNT